MKSNSLASTIALLAASTLLAGCSAISGAQTFLTNESLKQKRTEEIKKNPDSYLGYLLRADAEIQLKDRDGAIEDYTKAISLAEKNRLNVCGVYNARGSCYRLFGDFKKGIDDQNKAIALVNSGSADGTIMSHVDHGVARKLSINQVRNFLLGQYYTERGDDFADSGDQQNALDDYDKAIRYSFNSPNAFLYLQHRGSFYQSVGKHREAIADFGQALALSPQDSSIYAFRAKSYESIGEKDLAEQDRKKAQELAK